MIPMVKKSRIILISLLALLFGLGTSQIALALMDDPSGVSLYNEAVYRHLLEDDDFLFIVPYTLTYGSTPDTKIDDAFLFQLYDTDNTTLLGTVTAYPYFTNGYGEGMIAFYFDADSDLVWEESYIIRVQENPSQFETPTYWDFPLSAADYTSADTQYTNQVALNATIQGIATNLSITWDMDLLSQTEGGIVLSSYGENYFRNAVPRLQEMCPTLFSVQVEEPDFSERDWDYTIADAMLTRYNGTFIGDSMTGFAGLFGSDTTPTWNMLSIIMFAILICVEMAWTRKRREGKFIFSSKPFAANIWAASVDGFALLIYFTLLGMFSMVLNGLISFLCAVVAGLVLFLNRA